MNTEITFYCTHVQYGSFEKIIFKWVVPFTYTFKQAQEFVNHKIDYLYDAESLDLVFEWVVMHVSNTTEIEGAYHVKERIEGHLSFKSHAEKYKEKTVKAEPKPEPPKDYPSVFIEPNGTVHVVGFANHEEFACDWLNEHRPNLKLKWGQYHYEVMVEDEGWVRVLGWCNPPSFHMPKKITPRQKKAVMDYCQANGCDLPEELKN